MRTLFPYIYTDYSSSCIFSSVSGKLTNKYLYRIGEQIRELIYYEYIRGNTYKKPRDYETKIMYAYV